MVDIADTEICTDDHIAIVGMSLRVPGADTVDTFWRNIAGGVESVRRISAEALRVAGVDADTAAHPSYVAAAGIIDGIESFDAAFFGYTVNEASHIDPQHRLFLACAYHAMESAGFAPRSFEGAVGVFAGSAMSGYLLNNLRPELLSSDPARHYQLLTGNDKDFLTTRVSFKLGLSGPSVSVQTACSTSLTAVHLACQSLLAGECDMALAGGVSLRIPQAGYRHQEGMILSPDGHCRPFDARAAGTVPGSGCGVVALRRLRDAAAGREPIIAVIRGSAVNNDGDQKVGFTAPSVGRQSAVIEEALVVAAAAPATIGYLETHGTGTRLGDPIEIEALKDVFDRDGRGPSTCALGAVKANLGHLDAAAGVVGLIKAALVVRNGQIPPMCNFEKENGQLALKESALYIPKRLRQWRAETGPRRAGVSAFGIGGTNVHVVLEEPPPRPLTDAGPGPFVLPLSARTRGALERLVRDTAGFIQNHPDTPVAHLCHTAIHGRERFRHRAAIVAEDLLQLYEGLTAWTAAPGEAGQGCYGVAPDDSGRAPKVGFLFTGQGAQYAGMGADLYDRDAVFRSVIDRCDAHLRARHDLRLTELLYGDAPDADGRLRSTRVTQPAMCAVALALAETLAARGVVPDFVMGHSLGEYAAACVAGVLDIEQTLELVALRGRLMAELPEIGAMAAVFAPEAEIRGHLEEMGGALAVASINGPTNTVVSGPSEEIARLALRLGEAGIRTTRLAVSHAFHSALMTPMLPAFEEALKGARFGEPRVPLISNTTGAPAGDAIRTPAYWLNHILSPVRFSKSIATLRDLGCRVFVELGPRPVLTEMARALQTDGPGQELRCVSTLARGENDVTRLSAALAALFTAGLAPDLAGTARPGGARICLPGYPFEPTRCWIDEDAGAASVPTKPEKEHPMQSSHFAPRPALEAVSAELRAELGRITGAPVETISSDRDFFSLGMDSLMLVRVRQYVSDTFGVDLPVSALFARFDTVAKLSTHILGQRPPADPPPAPAEARPLPLGSAAPPEASAPLDATLADMARHQLSAMSDFMERQLAVLAQAGGALAPTGAPPAPCREAGRPASAAFKRPKHITMFQHIGEEPFTEPQRRFLSALIERYTAKTLRSKQWIAAHRDRFADWINAVNFRSALKEMQYPIVSESSSGAYITDIDGNRYLDLAMGYGVCFLGHRFEPVRRAIEAQLERGYQLGPQFSVTGEVVALLCEMTGVERVVFTNTGSEAVMFAVRVARATTRRDKIAIFSGSYHGMFDGVLAAAGDHGVEPAMPGTTQNMVSDIILLNYGDEASLERLRNEGSSLAAIVVEPVQSRRPGFQPRAFLHELRRIADACGAALVFDEIITGFRICPGGAQEHFDVRADIVTYGKVVGGGMPIGIVAGKAAFMDAIDGGTWSYGDDSAPRAEPTAFAGTFCKHPLTMVAVRAALTYLKEQGPGLQREVNQRTLRIVEPLNAFFEAEQVPIRIRCFGSVFRFESFGKYDLSNNPIEMELLFHLLMDKGIYTWERHICFLSIAHTDAEADRVVALTKESIQELRDGGFTFSSGDRPAEEEGRS